MNNSIRKMNEGGEQKTKQNKKDQSKNNVVEGGLRN